MLQVQLGDDDLPRYRLPVSERIYAREQLKQTTLDKRSVVQLNGLQGIFI
jgi:hypothetical protein